MNNIRKIIIKQSNNEKFERNPNKVSIYTKRTETDILNDFEALGWNIADGYVNFTLKKIITKNNTFGSYLCYCYIVINKENQTYRAEQRSNWNTEGYDLTMQEHKLLTELFEVIF
jgi:hypothetical protein